jgi:RNA polymerase sigma factor (sigma-70 family)
MDAGQALDDRTLVELIRSSDMAKSNLGLGLWMERDKSKIERFVHQRVSSRNVYLVDDIVQDVYWHAYRNIRSGQYQQQAQASLTAYARGIARWVVQAENRRRDNRNQSLEKVGEDGETQEQDLPDPCQDGELDQVETLADLIPALEWLVWAYATELKPHERELLYDKFVAEIDSSEVAAKLGMKSGTIRQQYKRLLAAMKKSAEKAGVKDPDQ